MGIRTIIAIGFALIVVNAQAATNSWVTGVSDFWDVNTRWSLGHAPALADSAEFITNATSKTVTIDQTDTSFFQSTLTISNLTVSGVGAVVNTLNLSNMSQGVLIPLHILNTMTISDGGHLQIVFSMLVASNAVISTNAVLLFALGTNSTTVVVSNNLTLGGTLNVANAGGFFNTNSYTLFTYGGALNYTGLTIGTTPSNTTCAIDTSVAGLVKLIVGGGSSSSSTASVQLISIVRSANDMAITWSASGGSTSLVQGTSGAIDGSYTSNNFADIPASQIIAPGTGIFTNTYTDVGGATNVPSHFYRIHYFQ